MRITLATLAISAFVGSCTHSYSVPDISSVPANPTYSNDIWPLYQDHCLFCHGAPSNRGAPSSFRLDVYDDVNGVTGAKIMGGSAVYDVKSNRMPPTAKVGDGVGPNGLQMLLNWQTNGFPQ